MSATSPAGLKEDTVFSITPAERPTPRTPVTLAGTWFGRMGLRPYELLGLTESVSTPTMSASGASKVLPHRDLAA